MTSYLIGRLLTAAGTIFAVITIVFMILHVVPGDPAVLLLTSGGGTATPENVAKLHEAMGLDAPLLTQYLKFLRDLASGHLGVSLTDGAPVLDNILVRLPRTLELILAAAVVAVIIGVPLGAWAGMRNRPLSNRILSFVSALCLAAPVFVTGTLLILLFGQTLKILPGGGFVPWSGGIGQHLATLLMPAATIAFGLSAVIFRMARTAVIETAQRDWVRTARAKGLNELRVTIKHVVRNALGPIVTILGLNLGALLGGTVLVEYVFNWPGLSGFLVSAVEQRDYPEVQGVVLVISIIFILLNLVIDILYGVIDPRVRQE
jgi:peptide/nickel transport system permease protein